MNRPRLVRPASQAWIIHASMQFSDRPAQMREDLEKIYALGADVITFTEAHHTNALHTLIPELGRQLGYTVYAHRQGGAIAVRRSYGRVTRRGYVPAIDANRRGDAVHGPRGVTWVRVRSKAGENVGFAVIHLVTGGNDPGDGFRYRVNTTYLKVAARWARNFAVGTNTAFIAGDMNDSDRRHDVFRGLPFTTCWDELRKWPDTSPYGNIDVIASWDADGRVFCRAATVLDDTEVRLHGDHFLIRATYGTRPLYVLDPVA